MNIITLPLSDLKPYPGNPRINDKAIEPVAASLKEFGWRQPIVVDTNNVVIVGHTRLLAAKKLGWTEGPVLIATDLTNEQVVAYRLADNRTNQNADWDWALLGDEFKILLSDAPDLMPITGFDSEEIKKATNYKDGGGVRETVPKERPTPITIVGDLWTSLDGEHIVLCGYNNGDAAKALLSTKQPDCIITDPPYNLGYSSAVAR